MRRRSGEEPTQATAVHWLRQQGTEHSLRWIMAYIARSQDLKPCRDGAAAMASVNHEKSNEAPSQTAPASSNGGERKRLTRARVLNAALELVDEQGAAALSMRRLAAKLDVDTMALYRHVRDKSDLLVGMIDTLQGTIDFPDESLDWRSWIRELALRRYLKLSQHPNILPIMVEYSRGSASTLRLMNRGLAVLERAGFDAHTVHRIWHLIAGHIVGGVLIGPHTANYLAHDSGDERFPVLHRYARVLQSCDRQDEFEFGLDRLLGTFEPPLAGC